jgi:hypothetical protein
MPAPLALGGLGVAVPLVFGCSCLKHGKVMMRACSDAAAVVKCSSDLCVNFLSAHLKFQTAWPPHLSLMSTTRRHITASGLMSSRTKRDTCTFNKAEYPRELKHAPQHC